MMEWYDNRLFGEINPVDESTEDGVGEEDTEVDPNDLFFWCRWGEMQSHAPTTKTIQNSPGADLRRSRI